MSGIWIIDAKLYAGRIERRDVGGWFSSDARLFVNGRDRTSLLDGLGAQRAAIVNALETIDATDVPVHTALCFVDGDWSLFAKPFELQGHIVAWPKALYPRIVGAGALQPDRQLEVLAALERQLPPAA